MFRHSLDSLEPVRLPQTTAKATMMASHRAMPLTSCSMVMFMGSSLLIRIGGYALGAACSVNWITETQIFCPERVQ